MTVRFLYEQQSVDVEYGWGQQVPRKGELISADGSDPLFPAGLYSVGGVVWYVSLDGPGHVDCLLESRLRVA